MSADPIVVGRLGRPHGLRGEFLVDVRTDVPERRFAVGKVLGCSAPGFPTLTVTASRRHSGRWVVRFAEVADRTGADVVRGAVLTIDPSEVGSAGDDEDDEAWWDSDLVGLIVVTVGGDQVGKVDDVLHPPGNDLLSIRTDEGAEILVPFVAEFVPTVDVPGGRLVVDPPEGLLDL
ncbi:MAG TPA: ribosome maturation factor RimM [Frankiaceae bacterium]|nr:ribosome maturation factor RimM [Frankiaceae bacterium]